MTTAPAPPHNAEGEAARPPACCRKKPSRALKERLLAAQGHVCFACGAPLSAVEYDHVLPLGLGGSNADDNWAALCPTCHRSKTREDLKAIARAKRRKRYQETGRSRAPHTGWNGASAAQRGFDKTLRKRIDGRVERVCKCPQCK